MIFYIYKRLKTALIIKINKGYGKNIIINHIDYFV